MNERADALREDLYSLGCAKGELAALDDIGAYTRVAQAIDAEITRLMAEYRLEKDAEAVAWYRAREEDR